MLPDNYLRKLKQDLTEAMVESKTRYVLDPNFCQPPPDDGPPS
jgi:hypothetical protein